MQRGFFNPFLVFFCLTTFPPKVHGSETQSDGSSSASPSQLLHPRCVDAFDSDARLTVGAVGAGLYSPTLISLLGSRGNKG